MSPRSLQYWGASGSYPYRIWIEQSNVLTPDRRAVAAGVAALQEAALAATVATSARLAEFAVHEAGIATTMLLETLRAPAGRQQQTWERALARLWEQDAEVFRVLAG